MFQAALARCVPIPWESPSHPIPKQGEKNVNTAENMLYIPWMVISGDGNIKQISFKTSICERSRVKKCISRLCSGPFTRPLLVETAISRLWHGLRTALSKARDCKKRPSVS